jgi:hypothetical protein
VQRLRVLPGVIAFENGMRKLPPWASLAAMLVPLGVLFPFKLLALWALGHGHFILGVVTYVAAKLVGMSLVAYIFDLVRDNARRIHWFDVVYSFIMKVLNQARAWLKSRPAYIAAKAYVERVRTAFRAWRVRTFAALLKRR